MSSADFDFSEAAALTAQLESLPEETRGFARKAIEVSARNVKENARQQARSDIIYGHASLYWLSIGYDAYERRDELGSIIGPDKARPQGALGNLLEYGSVKNPPQPTLEPALRDTEDDFVKGIEQAIEDGIRAAGL